MRRVSLTSDGWRKSSCSGGGDGNNCVEIAGSPTHAAVRDSKAPNRGILTFHRRRSPPSSQASRR
ncbi:DUF397 domain-containing protein [Streptomyces cellulosae]